MLFFFCYKWLIYFRTENSKLHFMHQCIKNIRFYLKKKNEIDPRISFKRPPMKKSIKLKYASIQLFFETFFNIVKNKRVISLDKIIASVRK